MLAIRHWNLPLRRSEPVGQEALESPSRPAGLGQGSPAAEQSGNTCATEIRLAAVNWLDLASSRLDHIFHGVRLK